MKIRIEIAKLDLQPGDILAVRMLRKNVPPGDAERLQTMLSKFVGKECRVLVMDPDMELTVVRDAAPAKRLEPCGFQSNTEGGCTGMVEDPAGRYALAEQHSV